MLCLALGASRPLRSSVTAIVKDALRHYRRRTGPAREAYDEAVVEFHAAIKLDPRWNWPTMAWARST